MSSEEKYVVRKEGKIMGGYAGKSGDEALDAHAKEQGFASHKEMCSDPNVSAAQFTVVHSKDAHK